MMRYRSFCTTLPFVATTLSLNLFVALWVLYRYFAVDPCDKAAVLQDICDSYLKHQSVGKLCYEICISKTVDIGFCDKHSANRVEFVYHSLFEMDEIRYIYHMAPWPSFSSFHEYEPIPVGTTYDQFYSMLLSFVNIHTGIKNNTQLADHLMSVADVNADDKISQPEAETLWFLLHSGEFFNQLVLQSNSVIPRFFGYCGQMYSVENVPHRSLFSYRTFLGRWWPSRYHNKIFPHTLPEWEVRAEHFISLLEYIGETTDGESLSNYYMCNFNKCRFGTSRDHRLRITDLSKVVNHHVLSLRLATLSCTTDANCSFGTMCHSTCNRLSKQCDSAMPHQTMLYYACDLMREYVLYGCPSHIEQKLQELLNRCLLLFYNEKYESNREIFELEYNLVISQLSSILWNAVKDSEELHKDVDNIYFSHGIL